MVRLCMEWAAALSGLALTAALAFPASATEIRGAGASFPANLYFGWIDAFEEVQPDIDVRYESVGSGEGIRRFLEGESDFGASDRALTEEQVASAPDGVIEVPGTAGMVVVAYNLPGIEGQLRLSRTALAGIFTGEIRYWDDPILLQDNPDLDLPHRSIAVVARRDSSGTTFAFTSHLDAISDIWRISGRQPGMIVDWPGGAMTVPGNDGVAGRIAISEFSLGYVEFSFAQMLDLPTAALQNAAGGFVQAGIESGQVALASTAESLSSEGTGAARDPQAPGAYPIVSYSWLLLKNDGDDPEVQTAVRDFVRWGLTEGQEMAEPIGYIPLPEEVTKRALAAIEDREPGF